MKVIELKRLLPIAIVGVVIASCGIFNKDVKYTKVSVDEKEILEYMKEKELTFADVKKMSKKDAGCVWISSEQKEILEYMEEKELNLADVKTLPKKNVQYMWVSDSQKEIIEYTEENKLTIEDIQTLSQKEKICRTTCCDKLTFCGISRDSVIKYIKKYKKENWYDSSPFFTAKGISRNNMDAVMRDITNGTSSYSPDPYEDANNFDSRFMDISITQLENYLCFIRNCPEMKGVNYCRFYYMKYNNDPSINPDYWNKMSLALVPVAVDTSGGGHASTQEYTDAIDLKGGQIIQPIMAIGGQCGDSDISNHNHLCPPFNNCVRYTMIEEVDKQ